MRTLTALTATALAALVLAAPADAQGRFQRPMAPRGDGFRGHIVVPFGAGSHVGLGVQARSGLGLYQPRNLVRQREFLELTGQQVARLEQLEAQVQEARDGADEAIREHRDALAEAMDADQPDVNAVRQHAQALHAAQQGVQLAHLTATAEAKGLLTDEQRTKIEAWVAGARRGAAWGGRGMMIPGGRMPMGRGMGRIR